MKGVRYIIYISAALDTLITQKAQYATIISILASYEIQ